MREEQGRRRSPGAGPTLPIRTTVLLVAAVLLSACGSTTRRDHAADSYHVVRSGETLYTIAWRYGRDYRDLARWNRLGDGSLIYPGQVIQLKPPSGTRQPPSAAGQQTTGSGSRPSRAPEALPSIPAELPPPLAWPTSGQVVVEFGGRPGSGTGVLIDGRAGQPIRAAAAGRVVYSGGGLIGYGHLVIIKHNDTYLSAYGHNASLLVREGETIQKGQRIATMGEGPGREPRLHFEIRRNGQPVDPRQFLPAR